MSSNYPACKAEIKTWKPKIFDLKPEMCLSWFVLLWISRDSFLWWFYLGVFLIFRNVKNEKNSKLEIKPDWMDFWFYLLEAGQVVVLIHFNLNRVTESMLPLNIIVDEQSVLLLLHRNIKWGASKAACTSRPWSILWKFWWKFWFFYGGMEDNLQVLQSSRIFVYIWSLNTLLLKWEKVQNSHFKFVLIQVSQSIFY